MFNRKKKYDVSDPALYGPLIAEQKKHVRRNLKNAEGWVKLGSLYESRLKMTNDFARHVFVIRYFLPILTTLALLIITAVIYLVPDPSDLSSQTYISVSILTIFIIIFFFYLWTLRYPSSGIKYFKKALKLDSKCADACMGLGFIYLRRHQKKKAFRFMEHAAFLGGGNGKKIERELKSIYVKEFIIFFEEQAEKVKAQQDTLNKQGELIKQLQAEKAQLENKVDHFSARVSQVKWESGRTAKLVDREMDSKISAIHKEYEEKIADLKEEMIQDAKEFKTQNFMRLTTEILELKTGLEKQSFQASSIKVEDIMGKRYWQALSGPTHLYLATAEQVWSVLLEEEEKPDFSLVGMELCKALETEINRCLVKPFAGYLNGKEKEFLKINQIGDDKSRPLYFTYLAKVVDSVHYPEITSLTLGQFLFILEHTIEGDFALSHYEDFMDGINNISGNIMGKAFLSNLKTVVKRYRNLITHHSPMDEQQLYHLRDLVFAGENSLLQTCSKIMLCRKQQTR
jgi:phage host-nuclease inhibitor protein Gam